MSAEKSGIMFFPSPPFRCRSVVTCARGVLGDRSQHLHRGEGLERGRDVDLEHLEADIEGGLGRVGGLVEAAQRRSAPPSVFIRKFSRVTRWSLIRSFPRALAILSLS